MPDDSDSCVSEAEPVQHSGWLTVSVVHDDGVWAGFEATQTLIAGAAEALASHSKFQRSRPSEACLALSSDTAVQVLNATYRHIDKPTNVLSFPASSGLPSEIEDTHWLGDVVIAEETVTREAAEQGVSVSHHLQHLALHGLLHLLGYDHETDQDAAVMEALEVEILATLGIANPYGQVLHRAEETAAP